MSDSASLYTMLHEAADDWTYSHGTRDQSVAFAGLMAYLPEAVEAYFAEGGAPVDGSEVERLILKIAGKWAKAGWGPFLRRAKGRKGLIPSFGYGRKPRGPRRPHATAAARAQRRNALYAAKQALDDEGVKGRGHGGRYSVAQYVAKAGPIVTRAAVDHHRGPIGCPAHERGRRTLGVSDRLMLAELEMQPARTLGVYLLTDVMAKLYPVSSHAPTIRKHRQRARECLARIAAAKVGLNVGFYGEYVIVGRGRAIPHDCARLIAKSRIRTLRSGPQIRHMKVWDSAEGQLAIELAQYHQSRHNEIHDEVTNWGDASPEQLEKIARIEVGYAHVLVDAEVPEARIAGTIGLPSRQRWELRERFMLPPDGMTWPQAITAYKEAFTDLHLLHARDRADLGDQLRWLHAKGGHKMGRMARRVASLLTGVRTVEELADVCAATPLLRRRGRQPQWRLTSEAPKKTRRRRPVRVLATPARSRRWTPPQPVAPAQYRYQPRPLAERLPDGRFRTWGGTITPRPTYGEPVPAWMLAEDIGMLQRAHDAERRIHVSKVKHPTRRRMIDALFRDEAASRDWISWYMTRPHDGGLTEIGA